MNTIDKFGEFVRAQVKRAHTFFTSSHPHLPHFFTLTFFTLLLFAAATAEAMPQRLTYRGVLKKEVSGIVPVHYAVYDSSLKGSAALWERDIPTKVESNGVFYVEIEDGSVVKGNSLADALAHAGGVPEIAISMDGSEVAPRMRLSTWVRGTRALRAKGVDVVDIANFAVVPGTACVYELAADTVTVTDGSGSFPDKCYMTPMQQRTLGGSGAKVVLKGVRIKEDAWPFANSRKDDLYTTESALADAVVTYENADGAFSLVVPQGGQITGAEAAGTAHTVSVSAYGPMTSSIK